jgi:NADH-quinone oxidoreductase subunit L
MTNLSLGVLLLPLLGFIILGLSGVIMPRAAVLTVAWGACGLAFLCALISFLSMLGTPEAGRVSDHVLYLWMGTSGLQISFGLLYDQLSGIMLLVVTGVGLLIHIYSAGYMADDPGFWRFFAYLNFFIFAMVLLVTADSFLFLLVGWGLVGLASFLLIGFWYQRPAAVAAAKKAFVINVIGDFGLMLAVFLIIQEYHSVNYQDVFGHIGQVGQGSDIAVGIALLLFLACAAKSAQLPLYMWLPDAMEGPTPVSALIHAATMVTAGVYLVARSHLLFDNAPVALYTVAGIGGVTALFAATIALFQLDIKRVLAYSTISQLGYMFMAEGAHNYAAGIFHLSTHAYFKALLFLGAGAVIHALGGEQDIRKMGGLRKRMPITYWTFLAAVLAISGFPFLAGFWSKDEILSSLFQEAASTGNIWFYVLWIIGLLTAGLTAFYMFRLFFGIFVGNYRGEPAASHTDEEDELEAIDGHHAGQVSYYHIHEVGRLMSIPLIILGILSVIGGFVGSYVLFNSHTAPFADFLAPRVGSTPYDISTGIAWISTALALVLAVLGFLTAWRLYGRGFSYKENSNPFYRLLLHKYYVDEALDTVLVKPIQALGRGLNKVLEGNTLDGGSRGVAALFQGTSSALRRIQTGYMRNYALGILFGVVLIVLYYVVVYAVRG